MIAQLIGPIANLAGGFGSKVKQMQMLQMQS